MPKTEFKDTYLDDPKRVKLAILIPFYKLSYFEYLLASLANQTDQRFNVYIGDDCSPDDPTELIDRFFSSLRITYHRFDTRLGNACLTKQWERCLALSQHEEWVWILPDDDLPSANVVEEFYDALSREVSCRINVFRLPLQFIDKSGSVTRPASPNPLVETNYDFYSRLLRGKTESSLGDNIFRRHALVSSGGFVEFQKAWGSDHATVLKVSAGRLLYCLQNANLGFRMSGENISSDDTDGDEKMAARVAFAHWLKRNEGIFGRPLDAEFYKYFYWKGEHYAVHEFPFSCGVWRELLRLRRLCMPARSSWPFIKTLLQKLLLDTARKARRIFGAAPEQSK